MKLSKAGILHIEFCPARACGRIVKAVSSVGRCIPGFLVRVCDLKRWIELHDSRSRAWPLQSRELVPLIQTCLPCVEFRQNAPCLPAAGLVYHSTGSGIPPLPVA